MGKITLFVTVLICVAAYFQVDSIAVETLPAAGAAKACTANSIANAAASTAAASHCLFFFVIIIPP